MQSDSYDSYDWESTESETDSKLEASQNCNVETSQVPLESIVLIPGKSFKGSRDENEP